jgi:hypothetical protein
MEVPRRARIIVQPARSLLPARSHVDVSGSGRTMARCGLRMMPPFPSSPLSFRTAGFPQYGWKAGVSDETFPYVRQLKPAPGIHRLTSGLSSPFVLQHRSAQSRICRRDNCTTMRVEYSTLPQGPSLRFRLCCPDPSSLIRPHAPHSRAQHNFISSTYMCCLSCAGAPRPPASSSGLSLSILSWHAIPYRPRGVRTLISSRAATST